MNVAAKALHCAIPEMHAKFGRAVTVFEETHAKHWGELFSAHASGAGAVKPAVHQRMIVFNTGGESGESALPWAVDATGTSMSSFCMLTAGHACSVYGSGVRFDPEGAFELLGIESKHWDAARRLAMSRCAALPTEYAGQVLLNVAPTMVSDLRRAAETFEPNAERLSEGDVVSVYGGHPHRYPSAGAWHAMMVLRSCTGPALLETDIQNVHRWVVALVFWCFEKALQYLWEDRHELWIDAHDYQPFLHAYGAARQYLTAAHAFDSAGGPDQEQTLLWARHLAAMYRVDLGTAEQPEWVPVHMLSCLSQDESKAVKAMVTRGRQARSRLAAKRR